MDSPDVNLSYGVYHTRKNVTPIILPPQVGIVSLPVVVAKVLKASIVGVAVTAIVSPSSVGFKASCQGP